MAVLIVAMSGCSSWRTARHSVPAACIRPRLFDAPRSSKKPINYLRLRQNPPLAYRLGPEDVLGIYIEGVLGRADQAPPVRLGYGKNSPPAMGYPVLVREDGIVSLPFVPPIQATGLTLSELENIIRKAYTIDRKILQAGRDRIIVTLMNPRTYQVLVIRKDALPSPAVGGLFRPGEIIQEARQRGMTYTVELPAYENDVLHALSMTGGMPGVDAKNEVVILRGDPHMKNYGFSKWTQNGISPSPNSHMGGPELSNEVLVDNTQVVRIPLRIGPDDPPLRFTEDDIILKTGDVLVVESRESEVFYTGGLLKGGQFPVPRDYDLDVFGAIAMSGGSIASAAGGTGPAAVARGGSIFPPTRATIVRSVGGQQSTIRVDLSRAIIDPKERILIQPNDFILLEYTTPEMIGNLITNNLFVSLGLSGPLWK